MSADATPEILTVRISREDVETLKWLALGLENVTRVMGANLETKSAVLVLMSFVARAERQ